MQKQNRIFNHLRWGEGPARVVLEMAAREGQEKAEIELETAPFDMMPHAIHYFLTLIEAGWVGRRCIVGVVGGSVDGGPAPPH